MPLGFNKTTEAARKLGVSKSTLEKWRITGEGPDWYRAGKKIVIYTDEAIEHYRVQRLNAGRG